MAVVRYLQLSLSKKLQQILQVTEKMINSTKCNNCHKLIEPQKLQLHYMMCSTAHLRRSQVKMSQVAKKPLQKCVFCQQLFQKEEINFHLNHGCRHRLVPCIDCDDMFPLSLFTEHIEVCRGLKERKQIEQKKQEKQHTLISNLITGLSIIGESLYEKGTEAVNYCHKKIEQNRPAAFLYMQQFRSKLYDTLQDLFQSMAYDQNVEGMPREEIRNIPLSNYKKKSNVQQEQICTICYCQLQQLQAIKELKCKHIYHPDCIQKWLRINRTCPLCKRDQMQ